MERGPAVLLLVWAAVVAGTQLNSSIYDFDYIINPKHSCRKFDAVDILIWVHSAPAHSRRRTALRETWANRKRMPGSLLTEMVFFLGATADARVQRRIEYESELYGDLVQENYQDSYRNLTYKAMSALKWVNSYCTNVNYIVKTDDDMVLDMPRLVRHLRSLVAFPRAATNTIICDVFENRRAIRRKGSKWFVEKEEYQENKYPPYCPGLALIMSGDLVSQLLRQSERTPYFWVDDVYFTGMLTEELNVTWVNVRDLFTFSKEKPLKRMDNSYGNVLFWHVSPHSVDWMYFLWATLSK